MYLTYLKNAVNQQYKKPAPYIFGMIYKIRLIWVSGWVGAGLYRLFVSLKYSW